jgi:hypothetical protein
VADHLQFSNGNIRWNLSVIKHVKDWEVDFVIVF